MGILVTIPYLRIMTLKEYFEKNPGINAAEVAKQAGFVPNLMYQYVGGHKIMSEKRLKAVEKAIRNICKAAVPVNLTRF